jgi:hypothetical protein
MAIIANEQLHEEPLVHQPSNGWSSSLVVPVAVASKE